MPKSTIQNTPTPVMSEFELARLGNNSVAYIRMMSSEDARKAFPQVSDIPVGLDLFAVYAADGEPIALTDTMQAALGHVQDKDLTIATRH